MPPMLQGLNTFMQLQGLGANRAQNAAGISGAQQPQQPPSLVPPAPPVDLIGSFESGKEAAKYARGGKVRGYLGGGPVEDDGGGDDSSSGSGLTGVSDLSPALIELTKRMMSGQSDDSPTSEDKGLALAQAGFSMAAGQSPHALSNIGAGASSGIEALQRLKQQRALQRMKQEQLQQSGLLRVEQLQQAKQSAADKIAAQRESIQQRADAAAAAAQAKSEHEDTLRLLGEQKGAAAKSAADALAEQRYTQADQRRRAEYNKTGQWSKIAGDDDHGISGAPESQEYEGAVINDPRVSPKKKEALIVGKPKQDQALSTISTNLDETINAAKGLMTHPGLQGAVGFRMGQEAVPGTDAASFKADLNSLLSKQFAQSIQAMRDASRTGGAVGNVSDREGDRFESMVASLSQNQSEDQFKKNLQRVIDYADKLRGSYTKEYEATYGPLKDMKPVDAPAAAPGGPSPGPSQAPPPAAIDMLKKNPGTAAHFDAMFGPGSSTRFLGGT